MLRNARAVVLAPLINTRIDGGVGLYTANTKSNLFIV